MYFVSGAHVSHLENVAEEELNRLLRIVVDVENLFMCVHKEEDSETKRVYFHLFKVRHESYLFYVFFNEWYKIDVKLWYHNIWNHIKCASVDLYFIFSIIRLSFGNWSNLIIVELLFIYWRKNLWITPSYYCYFSLQQIRLPIDWCGFKPRQKLLLYF